MPGTRQRLPTGKKSTTRRITGLAGLGVVALFGVGNALWAFEQPDAGAGAAPSVLLLAVVSASLVRSPRAEAD